MKLYMSALVNCSTPEQCPTVVSLLSESYNPHVRCGAALALGIACAGTGNRVMTLSMCFVYTYISISACMYGYCMYVLCKHNCVFHYILILLHFITLHNYFFLLFVSHSLRMH